MESVSGVRRLEPSRKTSDLVTVAALYELFVALRMMFS